MHAVYYSTTWPWHSEFRISLSKFQICKLWPSQVVQYALDMHVTHTKKLIACQTLRGLVVNDIVFSLIMHVYSSLSSNQIRNNYEYKEEGAAFDSHAYSW